MTATAVAEPLQRTVRVIMPTMFGFIFGLLGSLSIGVGFVNVFMILIKQYLGHLVTIITIIGGIVLDVIGLHIFSLVK